MFASEHRKCISYKQIHSNSFIHLLNPVNPEDRVTEGQLEPIPSVIGRRQGILQMSRQFIAGQILELI